MRKNGSALIILAILIASVFGFSPDAIGDAVGHGGLLVTLPSAAIAPDASNTGGASTTFGVNQIKKYTVLGQSGVPASGVSAVLMSFAVTQTSSSGLALLVGSSGSDLSDHTVLRVDQNTAPRSTMATVIPGSDGAIQVETQSSSGTATVVATITGYFTAVGSSGAAAGGYVALDQTTLGDSTTGSFSAVSGQVPAGVTQSVQVTGNAGIPSDASAVFASVSVSSIEVDGALNIWAADQAESSNPSFEYSVGGPEQSAVMIPISGVGTAKLHNTGSSNVAVRIDVEGYVTSDPSKGGGFTSIPATQAYSSQNSGQVSLGANQSRQIRIGGTSGIPTYGAAGVLMTLSAVNNTATGGLDVYPTDGTDSGLSSIRFSSSEADWQSALALIQTGTDGFITVRNDSTGPVDFRVVLTGWFESGAPLALDEHASGKLLDVGGHAVAGQTVSLTVQDVDNVRGSSDLVWILGSAVTDAQGNFDINTSSCCADAQSQSWLRAVLERYGAAPLELEAELPSGPLISDFTRAITLASNATANSAYVSGAASSEGNLIFQEGQGLVTAAVPDGETAGDRNAMDQLTADRATSSGAARLTTSTIDADSRDDSTTGVSAEASSGVSSCPYGTVHWSFISEYKHVYVPIQTATLLGSATANISWSTTALTQLGVAVDISGPGDYGGGLSYSHENDNGTGISYSFTDNYNRGNRNGMKAEWTYKEMVATCVARSGNTAMSTKKWVPYRWTGANEHFDYTPGWTCESSHRIRNEASSIWTSRSVTAKWSGWFTIINVKLNNDQTTSSSIKSTWYLRSGSGYDYLCGHTDTPIYAATVEETN